MRGIASRSRQRERHPSLEQNIADTEAELPAARRLERLIFLSDGVFAIAMTLLVVDLRLPDIVSPDASAVASALLALWPKYIGFGISFVVSASYWMSHQRIFSYVVRTDGRFVWLNVVLLLCVAFQPFPTSVLGSYGTPPAVIFYAATLCVTGTMILIMWLYATTRRRLVRSNLDSRLIQHHALRAASAPLVFLISIPIARVDPTAAELSWMSVAVIFVVLRWLYRDARKTAATT